MHEVVLNINGKSVVLNFKDFGNDLDLDELTSIDYSNIYGEAVTISALLSKLGIMRAEAEKYLNDCKLDHDIYEARLKKECRKHSVNNLGKIKMKDDTEIKLTENALEEIIKANGKWIEKKRAIIEAKRQYDYIDAVFWAASSKDKKLNNLVKAITPAELFDELVEGAINGILISKNKMTYYNKRE